MDKNYETLGVSIYATDEEIAQKYNELNEKYRKERFLEGEAGNYAAKRLTEIQIAYSEILEERKEHSDGDDGLLKDVENAIRNGDLRLAQEKLDAFNERNSEWHYLQSVIFYKKNWNNESKKQLEIAMQMNANNEKYKTAYDKLNAKMNASKSSDNIGEEKQFSSTETAPNQMGGESCLDFCCRSCALSALLSCCCGSCN